MRGLSLFAATSGFIIPHSAFLPEHLPRYCCVQPAGRTAIFENGIKQSTLSIQHSALSRIRKQARAVWLTACPERSRGACPGAKSRGQTPNQAALAPPTADRTLRVRSRAEEPKHFFGETNPSPETRYPLRAMNLQRNRVREKTAILTLF